MSVVAALRGVQVTYPSPTGPVEALRGVDLELLGGTATAIVGRSGSGKSTLVSVLALMRRPTAGEVELAGRTTTGLDDHELARLRARSVGIVFQSFHLDPALSASDNVMLPWYLDAAGRRRRDARRRADQLLELLGIPELSRRRPTQMSGGQRQRVAIARALFNDPVLFVADEPTGNLDEDTANEVAAVLLGLADRTGTTVVVVTHDRRIADAADRTLHVSRGRITEPVA